MNTNDISRRAKSSYMISVSDRTDDETRSNLNDFLEQHTSIDITKNHTLDDARDLVDRKMRDLSDPIIVVHKYDEMSEDMRVFLAQYLKGVAEKHTEVPIVVFDPEGGNLGMANPDLRGRVYSL